MQLSIQTKQHDNLFCFLNNFLEQCPAAYVNL
jgi:hypothetical protein